MDFQSPLKSAATSSSSKPPLKDKLRGLFCEDRKRNPAKHENGRHQGQFKIFLGKQQTTFQVAEYEFVTENGTQPDSSNVTRLPEADSALHCNSFFLFFFLTSTVSSSSSSRLFFPPPLPSSLFSTAYYDLYRYLKGKYLSTFGCVLFYSSSRCSSSPSP